MDAVYILGSESPAKNEEIRHSVRSLDRNMADLRDIYIIGENPGFLPNAKHIPFPDEHTEKWKNAYSKVLRACKEDSISEDFLLMNDDFIIQEPMTGADFPFFALKGAPGGACGPYCYLVHCPIRLNKELYTKMPFDIEQKACPSPRTFYANFYRCPPEYIQDPTVNLIMQLGTFDEQAAGKPFFSFSNTTARDPGFIAWLHSQFPDPSRFE